VTLPIIAAAVRSVGRIAGFANSAGAMPSVVVVATIIV
jgi:hypothetical protein